MNTTLQSGPAPAPRKWLMLAAVCLTLLTLCASTTSTITAMVEMSRDLSMPPGLLPWIMNAYTLCAAAFMLFGGRLNERFGAVAVYMAGGLALIASSMLIALSPSAALVLLGRAIQGLCVAAIMPTNVVLCKAAFPRHEHMLAIGILGGVGGLGFAFGTIAGGVLTHFLSWRYVFWMNLPLAGAAMAMMAASRLRVPLADKREPIDVRGVALLALGMIGLLVGLTRATTRGWTNPGTVGLLLGGTALLAVFILAEKRSAAPLLYLGFFRVRLFDVANVVFGLAYMGIVGVLFFFSLFVQNAALLNYSPARTGLALLPYSLAFFAVSLAAKPVPRLAGFRLPIVGSFVLAGLGFFLLSRVNLQTTYADLWLPLLLCALGGGMLVAIVPGLTIGSVSDELAGGASGVLYTQVYFYASLATVFGSNVTIATGRRTILALVGAADLAPDAQVRLDQVLIGHMSSIQEALAQSGPLFKTLTLDILKASTLASFTSAMLLFAAVSLAGGLLALLLLPEPRTGRAE